MAQKYQFCFTVFEIYCTTSNERKILRNIRNLRNYKQAYMNFPLTLLCVNRYVSHWRDKHIDDKL